jgi:peptidoglycan/LPS O-acetylase OafA/YrhL
VEKKPEVVGRYLVELESIRALMAWWVVLGHTYSYYQAWLGFIPFPIKKFLLATAIPVNIFVCLSGYLICASLKQREQSYSYFLMKRFARLFPLYIPILFVAIFFFESRYQIRAAAPWLDNSARVAFEAHSKEIGENFFANFVLSAMLLQGIVPNDFLNHAASAFLAPAWSLSLEWQFYLLAPIILGRIRRSFSTQFSMLILAGGGIAYALSRLNLTFDYGAFLPLKLGFFLIGSFAARMAQERRLTRYEAKDFVVICAAMCVFVAFGAEKTSSAASGIFWLVGLALCLWGKSNQYSTQLIATVRWLLQRNFLAYLGKISYATYLCHVLLLDFSVWLLLRLSVETLSPSRIALFVMAIVFSTFSISTFLYKFIEAPGMKFGTRFVRYEK